MTIRTVSQLPFLPSVEQKDLIEVSHYSSNNGKGGYFSSKCEISSLRQNFTQSISVQIGDHFSLYQDDGHSKPINVRQLSTDVNELYAGNVNLSGVKTFKKIPKIDVPFNEYRGANDLDVPNITKVKDLIDNRACFVSHNYMIDGDPGNDATPPFAADNETFMHWHIDDGQTDSTTWIDPQTNSVGQPDGVRCEHTGFLTIYGWLADNGMVLPQNAWVGLYAKMYVQKENQISPTGGQWVLLQVQPWIRGANATQLQYVCFNIPVREGLYLKIRTGFNVNGKVGGFQDGRSLTYALNQPNSFTGYIVRVKD